MDNKMEMEITDQDLVNYLAKRMDVHSKNWRETPEEPPILWEIDEGDFVVEDLHFFPFEKGDLVAYATSADVHHYWFRIYAADKRTKHLVTDAESILWFCNEVKLDPDMSAFWKMKAEAYRLISRSFLKKLSKVSGIVEVHNDRALERLILI